MKIGIIGQGYVGTAIKVGFEPHYKLETYDKYDEDKSTCGLSDMVAECEVIFVCVPTPMDEDGSCHTDIVESVVKEIDEWVSRYHKDVSPIVVINLQFHQELQIDYIRNIRVLMLYSIQSFLQR